MKGKISLTLLCFAVLAFACGPRTRSESASGNAARATQPAAQRAATTPQGAPRSANATRTSDSPLTPSLDVDLEDGVRFEFQVVNEGKKKLEIDFASGRTHDLVVLDSLGREVWRWSEGRLFTQAMVSKVLRTS